MKKFNFSKLFFVAALVASFVMLSGCKPAPDETKTPIYNGIFIIGDDDKLVATWAASEYEKYIITSETFESAGAYTGKELYVKKDSNTSGIIYVKYTKAYEFTTENKSEDPEWQATWDGSGYYRYSTTAPDVGKWYAIAYKDLTEDSISISGAYGAKSSVDTLKEAVQEFTIDNGYFGYYSECIKK